MEFPGWKNSEITEYIDWARAFNDKEAERRAVTELESRRSATDEGAADNGNHSNSNRLCKLKLQEP